jgi:transcriptional regulator of aromatic amino acid metabolism
MQFRRALLDNERLGEIQRRRGDMLEEEVTERVQQLQRRRRELMDLLASLPDGVMVVEGAGRIMMTNPIADTWMARDREDPNHPIQSYLETLPEDWSAEEWLVELAGDDLVLKSSTLAGSDGMRKVVVIQDQPATQEAIGPEEAIELIDQASHWLKVHPLQRAMQSTLVRLDELVMELRGKVQERPSTDELRRIEWSELDLNSGSDPGPAEEGLSAPPSEDALVEEDFDPGIPSSRP